MSSTAMRAAYCANKMASFTARIQHHALQSFEHACSDDDYNLALTDGAFSKLIQVQLVRKIEGEQFFGVSTKAS